MSQCEHKDRYDPDRMCDEPAEWSITYRDPFSGLDVDFSYCSDHIGYHIDDEGTPGQYAWIVWRATE